VFAQWNGSPVLIKWIEDKKDHAPIILAGDVQRKALANVTESVRSAGNVAASNPVEDPWSAWISSKGGTGLGSSGMQGRSTPGVQPPRKLESPIEDRFARHDSAVQALKQHTEHELGMLKESIAKIERSIEMQNANIQSNLELTNAEFKSLRTETSQQLQALTGAFTESLKSTIAAQETQLATQFAELKDMIKRRTGSAKTGTSPPQKKSKTGDGDESL
jgi:TolA-binding protein